MKDGIQIQKLWTTWPGHCIDWEMYSHSYKYKTCNNCDVIGNSVFIQCLDRCSFACIYSVRLLCKWQAHQISTITSRGLFFFFGISTQNTNQFNWGGITKMTERVRLWVQHFLKWTGCRTNWSQTNFTGSKNLDSNLSLASNVFWHMNLHDLEETSLSVDFPGS